MGTAATVGGGVIRPAWGAALPVPPGDAIAFKVFRNGVAVGEHSMRFTRDGDTLRGETEFAFTVRIAGIVAYRYRLTATETWTGGAFERLESTVNNDGTHSEVHAHKVADGYAVTDVNHNDPAKRYPAYTAPPKTLPLTYWNKAMLDGTVLNIATAHSYPVFVHSPGWNRLPTANGGSVVAQRFDVTGKLRLSVWYDQAGQWSGLEFDLHGHWNYEKIT
ncbi:MAG: hypothetical protein B7Z81_07860 [Acidocella sp. 20-61-6]|nr:MAG: hypothetical protein B7Z81_07860 [Acidocella sp. 20-61-6]